MPKKYYVVKRGHHAGVYYSWSDCQKEVTGFPGAIYKGFATKAEAEAWYGKPIAPPPKTAVHAAIPRKPAPTIETLEKKYPAYAEPMDISCISYDGKTERIILPETLIIYTDGSCLVNPNGPGGFAAVFLTAEGSELLTLSGGEPASTNNRMELRAAYEALKLLDDGIRRTITFHTDSKYLQKAITNRWLYNWKRNGWLTAAKTPVSNQDLWKALNRVMTPHRLTFEWVKGHVGTKYNEMCDTLAKGEAMKFKKS